MSTRERWIIYPLLFLTLGVALRDRVIPPKQFQAHELAAERIRCGQLQVGQILCEQARFKETVSDRVDCGQLQGKALLVGGTGSRPVVMIGMDSRTHGGLIEVLAADHAPVVQIGTSEGAGMVTTMDRGKKALVMGFFGKNLGLFAHLPGTSAVMPLTQPWQFEPREEK